MYTQYIETDSPLHRIPAVLKLYGLVLFILLSFLVQNLITAGVYLLGAAAVVRVSRIPVLRLLRKIRHALILLTAGFVFNLFSTPWTEALMIFIRLLAIVVTSQAVIMSTSSGNLIDGLERGFKMKSEYVISIMIAIAFIPILESTWKEISMAQSARGYDFSESTFLPKIRGLGALLIPLFRFSVKKAEILGEALTVKEYQ